MVMPGRPFHNIDVNFVPDSAVVSTKQYNKDDGGRHEEHRL
jgi:hypothetical protein